MKRIAALTLAAALTAAAPASAETLRLGYDVYVGGLPLGRMVLETRLDADRYKIGVGARAGDLLDRLISWSYEAQASGSLDGPSGVVPESFTSTRTLRGKRWDGRLTYAPDGTVAHSQEPPQSEEDANAVPPDQRAGTMDLLSAAVAIARAAEAADGNCATRAPVYDGRRRYDVVAEPGRNRTLKKNDYNVYEGVALGCRISIDPVAGFRPARRANDDFWTIPKDGSRRGFDLWLGRAAEDAPLLPVRLEAREMFYADIIGHLASVERVPDNQQAERP